MKANTLFFQLPGHADLCQSAGFDTLVFYKPAGYNSVTWYMDVNAGGFSYMGAADSLILIPSVTGEYSISLVDAITFNQSLFTMNIAIGLAPSPTFEIIGGGGQMNTTGDTAWLCGSSMSLGAGGIVGSDANSFWDGPGIIHSTDNPINAIPGKFYFSRENGCGLTLDSVHVVSLPTTLPIFLDTTLCNESFPLTINAGSGYFSYYWSTTENSQIIQAYAGGTYTVSVSNACVSGTASITIDQELFPLPDLVSFSVIPGPFLCYNEVAILDPNPGFTYDTYQWYQNGGSSAMGNQSSFTVDYSMGSSYFVVDVTVGNCVATANIGVSFYDAPLSPIQCVSTYDPTTGDNMTIIERGTDAETQAYVLAFKQGSNWIPIDTVPAVPGLSSYTLYDRLNDPNIQSQCYAVFTQHTCGNLSDLLDWHKTIRIAIFQDVISSDYVLQIMDDYETLSGYTPDSYTIWIDSLNNGTLTQIGILNGGNSSFTISAPVNGAAYYASVNLPWICDSAKSTNISYSNKRIFGPSSVSENQMQTLTIFPNPATNQISISGIETGGMLRLYDLSGKLLLERENRDNTLELNGISAGSYVLECESRSGVVRGRVVVEK